MLLCDVPVISLPAHQNILISLSMEKWAANCLLIWLALLIINSTASIFRQTWLRPFFVSVPSILNRLKNWLYGIAT